MAARKDWRNGMTARKEWRKNRHGLVWPMVTVLLIAGVALWVSLASEAAPVSITVPVSETAVLDTDLDGDPATGAWGDALSITVPLETGAAPPYGTARLYAKHDGANLFLRVDGSIDVPWLNPSGDRFWMGFQISQTQTAHHGGGVWDGTFFGLWDGVAYAPQPVYPPEPVDTHGFDRPPAADVLQDVIGALQHFGTSAPFAFTAEWRRPLNSGDADDLNLRSDGVTTYNFFLTTDSNGGGSAGGTISHRQVTNLNVMRLEATQSSQSPPAIVHTPPDTVASDKAVSLSARVTDNDGVAEVQLNYTDVLGGEHNETMVLVGFTYVYTIPAQNASGTLSYFIWAIDSFGAMARTPTFDITVATFLETPSLMGVVPTDVGCLEVTWTPIQTDVDGYRLSRWNATTGSMEPIAELAASESHYTDCDVEPDRIYTYWVVAFDAVGNESPPSALLNGRTSSALGPEPDYLPLVVGAAAGGALVAVLLVLFVQRRRRGPP